MTKHIKPIYQQIQNRFEDNQIRCTALYPLFMMPMHSMSEELEEEIYLNLEDIAHQIGLTEEQVARIEYGNLSVGGVIKTHYEKGFLALIETPVDNSWLHTSYTWFYSESIEEIAEKALNWKLNKGDK